MPSKNSVPAVFVRGVPLAFTDADLSAIFSDIAPVKRAFLVRNPATRESRGFGFVQFAFEDDAKLAVEKVNGQTVRGAKLFVSVAGHGKDAAEGGAAEAASRKGGKKGGAKAAGGAGAPAPVDPAAEVAPVPAVRPRAPRPPVKHGPTEEQLRTVALFGLPADFDKARLWKRVRKAADGIQTLEWPVLLPGSESAPVAYVLFDRKTHRDKAIAKLDAHSLLGATLHARPGEAVLHPADAFRSNRLIMRNLRFSSTAADVRAALVAKGVAHALTEVKVPMHGAADKEADAAAAASPEGAAPAAKAEAAEGAAAAGGRNRGFAFVQFATRADADAALKALNEVKVAGRPVAVDWALSQGAFAAASAATAGGAEAGAAAAAPATEEPAAAAAEAAPAAADEAEEAAEEDNEEESDAEEGADEDDEGEEDDDDDEDDDSEAGSDSESEDDVSLAGGDYENADAAAAVAATPVPAAPVYRADGVEAGTTIFLRNVLFESTDKDVYEGLKAFGPLRYARIVIDKESGRPRGTAFVQYYAKESADRALEAGGVPDQHSAPIPLGDASSSDAKARRDAALAAAVAAARAAGGIKVGGRLLLPSRAVAADEAARLVAEAKGRALADPDGAAAKKFDKRHTYLAYEGNVRPDSDVGKSIPSSDLAKRANSQKERKTKLASPLFFVSPTRLSVRNLAKGVNDASLRRMARIAAAAGLKEGLVSPTEGDPRLRAPLGARIKVQVVKAKVMRESIAGSLNKGKLARPRFEADGITPLSKGYGFVEFSNHQAALACLRKLNNNPAFTSYAAGGAAVLAKARARRKRIPTEILGGKPGAGGARKQPPAAMVDDGEEEEEEEGGFDATVADEDAAAAAGDALEDAFEEDEAAGDEDEGEDSDDEATPAAAGPRNGGRIAAPLSGPVPKGAGVLTHIVPASIAKECPRLIVEFAIEDWREVKKQESKKRMREERKKTPQVAAAAAAGARAGAAAAAGGKGGAATNGAPAAGKKRGRAEMEASSAPAAPAAGPKGAGPKGAAGKGGKAPRDAAAQPPPAKRARLEAAAVADDAGPVRPKGDTRRKKAATSEDVRHDALVASYMTKLFAAPGAGGAPAKAAAAGMDKWM